MTTDLQPPKNQDIQFLRGVAILLVMVQHFKGRLPTPQYYFDLFKHAQFWTGVDVFFAISGFLICQTFLRSLDATASRELAVKQFLMKRSVRLIPALLFWLLASVCLSFFLDTVPGRDPVKVTISAITAAFGVANVYWAQCVQGHIAACGSADFNGVTWSLSLEWQLYAILAFSLLLGRARGIWIMVALSAALSFFRADLFSYAWAFRPAAFTLGAIISLAFESRQAVFVRMGNNTAKVMLCAGVLICLLAPVHLPTHLVLVGIAFGGAICLASSLTGESYSASKLAKPITWIGERSYSVYLCHLPCILIAHQIMVKANIDAPSTRNLALGVGIALTITCLLSDWSYRNIERRFIRMSARPGKAFHGA